MLGADPRDYSEDADQRAAGDDIGYTIPEERTHPIGISKTLLIAGASMIAFPIVQGILSKSLKGLSRYTANVAKRYAGERYNQIYRTLGGSPTLGNILRETGPVSNMVSKYTAWRGDISEYAGIKNAQGIVTKVGWANQASGRWQHVRSFFKDYGSQAFRSRMMGASENFVKGYLAVLPSIYLSDKAISLFTGEKRREGAAWWNIPGHIVNTAADVLTTSAAYLPIHAAFAGIMGGAKLARESVVRSARYASLRHHTHRGSTSIMTEALGMALSKVDDFRTKLLGSEQHPGFESRLRGATKEWFRSFSTDWKDKKPSIMDTLEYWKGNIVAGWKKGIVPPRNFLTQVPHAQFLKDIEKVSGFPMGSNTVKILEMIANQYKKPKMGFLSRMAGLRPMRVKEYIGNQNIEQFLSRESTKNMAANMPEDQRANLRKWISTAYMGKGIYQGPFGKPINISKWQPTAILDRAVDFLHEKLAFNTPFGKLRPFEMFRIRRMKDWLLGKAPNVYEWTEGHTVRVGYQPIMKTALIDGKDTLMNGYSPYGATVTLEPGGKQRMLFVRSKGGVGKMFYHQEGMADAADITPEGASFRLVHEPLHGSLRRELDRYYIARGSRLNVSDPLNRFEARNPDEEMRKMQEAYGWPKWKAFLHAKILRTPVDRYNMEEKHGWWPGLEIGAGYGSSPGPFSRLRNFYMKYFREDSPLVVFNKDKGFLSQIRKERNPGNYISEGNVDDAGRFISQTRNMLSDALDSSWHNIRSRKVYERFSKHTVQVPGWEGKAPTFEDLYGDSLSSRQRLVTAVERILGVPGSESPSNRRIRHILDMVKDDEGQWSHVAAKSPTGKELTAGDELQKYVFRYHLVGQARSTRGQRYLQNLTKDINIGRQRVFTGINPDRTMMRSIDNLARLESMTGDIDFEDLKGPRRELLLHELLGPTRAAKHGRINNIVDFMMGESQNLDELAQVFNPPTSTRLPNILHAPVYSGTTTTSPYEVVISGTPSLGNLFRGDRKDIRSIMGAIRNVVLPRYASKYGGVDQNAQPMLQPHRFLMEATTRFERLGEGLGLGLNPSTRTTWQDIWAGTFSRIVLPGMALYSGYKMLDTFTDSNPMFAGSLKYEELVLVRHRNTGVIKYIKIGELVDKLDATEYDAWTNDNGNICFKPITAGIRHKRETPLVRLELANYSDILVTTNHSLFTGSEDELQITQPTIGSSITQCSIVPPREIIYNQLDILDHIDYDGRLLISVRDDNLDKWWKYNARGQFSDDYHRWLLDNVEYSKFKYRCEIDDAKTCPCDHRYLLNLAHYRSDVEIPITYDLNYNLGYLIGIFVSEGSSTMITDEDGRCSNASICISASDNYNGYKGNIREKVIGSILSVFPDANIRVTNKSIVLNGYLYYKFFRDILNCGSGASSKRIPDIIMNGANDCVQGFLHGYFDGDGNYKDKTFSLSTVSRELACQLILLLRQIGSDAYVYSRFRDTDSFIDARRIYSNYRLYTVYARNVKISNLVSPKSNHERIIKRLFNRSTITKMELVDQDEYVYDLSVEDSHKFIGGVGLIYAKNTSMDEGLTVGLAEQYVKSNLIASSVYDTVGITPAMRYLEGLMPGFVSSPAARLARAVGPPILGAAYGMKFGPAGAGLGAITGTAISALSGFGTYDLTKSRKELEDIYSGRELVPIRSGRFWEMCVTPDTQIITLDGVKPISDITTSDIVLTHIGNWKQVTNILPTDHPTENMYSLRLYGNSIPLRISGNHRIPSMVDGIILDRRVDELIDNDAWLSTPIVKNTYGDHKTIQISKYITLDNLLYEDGKIHLLQYTYTGSTSKNVFQRANSEPIPTSINLDIDTGRFIGLYLAEGNIYTKDGEPYGIEFTFNTKEKHLINFICDYIYKWIGKHPIITEKVEAGVVTNCTTVRIFNRLLGNIFNNLFGRDKKIPDFMWHVDSDNFYRGLVSGMIDGDGHIDDRNGRISTSLVAKNINHLIFIRNICLRSGIVSYLYRTEHDGFIRHQLYWGGENCKKLDHWCSIHKTKDRSRISNTNPTDNVYIQDGILWSKIKSIDRIDYNGPLYDITVEDDATYNTVTCAIHNSRTPWQGSRISYWRPNFFAKMKSQYQYTPDMYGSKLEEFIFRNPIMQPFALAVDPYHWERKSYFSSPYPETGAVLESVPFIGPALSTTVGRALKPIKLMHKAELQASFNGPGYMGGSSGIGPGYFPPPGIQADIPSPFIPATMAETNSEGLEVRRPYPISQHGIRQTVGRLFNTAWTEPFGLWGWGCVCEGSLIHTSRGLIPIEHIDTSDRVLGMDGNMHRVIRTYYNGISDNIYEISTTNNELKLTGNHQVPIVRKSNIDKNNIREYIEDVAAEDISSGDYIVYPVMNGNDQSIILDMAKWHDKNYGITDKYIYYRASRKWAECCELYESNPSISISEMVDHGFDRMTCYYVVAECKNGTIPCRSPRFIPMTEELAYLLGWYIAEGSTDKRQGNLELSYTELDYANQLSDIGKRIFGVPCYIKDNTKNRSTYTVVIKSRTIAKFLSGTFGRGAHNKHIPLEYKQMNIDLVRPLFAGLVLGDGWASQDSKTSGFGSVSKNLVVDMYDIGLRLGVLGSTSFDTLYGKDHSINGRIINSTPSSSIKWTSSSFSKIYEILHGYDPYIYGKKMKHKILVDGLLLEVVNSISKLDCSSNVYDIEVEDLHYYVANMITVHNSTQAIGGGPAISDTIYANAGERTSVRRALWDLQLGGGLGVGEWARRFYPRASSTLDRWNPLKNRMVSWLPSGPESKYFIDFGHGSPYDKIKDAELRLPGWGNMAAYHVKLSMPFRASQIGKSYEEMVQYITGTRPPTLAYEEDVMEAGTTIHRMVQDELRRSNLLVKAEVPVYEPYSDISGTVDAIVREGRKKVALEIKTVDSKKLASLAAPQRQHMSQLNFYLKELGLPMGKLVYISRDDPSQVKSFPVHYSERMYKQDLSRLQQARSEAYQLLRKGQGSPGEAYSHLDRLRVVSDIAAYSDEYKRELSIVNRRDRMGLLTPEEHEEKLKILRRRDATARQYDLYPRRFDLKHIIKPDSKYQIMAENEYTKAASEYNPVARVIGGAYEYIMHQRSPFHTKMMATYSPREQYERYSLYGTKNSFWTEPWRDFVEPYMRATLSTHRPDEGIMRGLQAGYLFGGPAGAALGAGALGVYGAVHGGFEWLTDSTYIPGNVKKKWEIADYFDKLKYIKARRLYMITGSKEYAQTMGETMTGINPVGNPWKLQREIARAVPPDIKPYIFAFIQTTDHGERDKIAKEVPEPVAQLLRVRWAANDKNDSIAKRAGDSIVSNRRKSQGDSDREVQRMAADYQQSQDLTGYFERHNMPPEDYAAFDPRIRLEDVELKTVKKMGYSAFDFGMGYQCIPPYQKLYNKYGYEYNAGDITEDNIIMSGNGYNEGVIKVHRRVAEDEIMVKVGVKGNLIDTMEATSNHHILAVKCDRKCIYSKQKRCIPDSYSHDEKCDKCMKKYNYTPEYIRIGELEPNTHFIVYPSPKYDTRNIRLSDIIDIESYKTVQIPIHDRRIIINGKDYGTRTIHSKGWDKELPFEDIQIDKPNIFRLFGYYLAEGSIMFRGNSIEGITISFHSDEHDYIDDVSKILEDEFNIIPKIFKCKDKKCVRIIAYSKFLGSIFLILLGRYSYGKCINPILFSANNICLAELVKGYVSGDGCIKNGKKSYMQVYVTSVSETLIRQIRYILLSIGIKATTSKQIRDGRNDTYCMTIYGNEFYKLFNYNNDIYIPDYYYYRVNSVDKSLYSGIVLDYTINNEHSYVSGVGVYHNSQMQRIRVSPYVPGPINISDPTGNEVYPELGVNKDELRSSIMSILAQYGAKNINVNVSISPGVGSLVQINASKEADAREYM